MENVKKTIQVRLSEVEGKMFQELCGRFGCGVTALVKDWLRYNHKKAFPAYGAGAPKSVKPLNQEEELNPEQLCEKYGGKIVEVEGSRVCRFPTVGQSGQYVPLSDHANFKKYYKP